MGDPYFKVKPFLESNGVSIFSSNYSLYGELSSRFYQTIASLVDDYSPYSIDEVFLRLDGMPEPLNNFARELQSRVLQWTGLPIGIGIGHTKTLAKAAQHASKLWRDRTGGVVDLRSQHAVEWLLKRMPVDEVWGIGRRMRENLAQDGITTAWELSQADPRALGRKYSVVLERTIRELRGEACMDLEDDAPVKQSICSSKMFGVRLHTLPELQQALATYIHRAAEKLRKQRSLCGALRVGIQTSFHGSGPKYANGVTCIPEYPTDDVRQLTKHAHQALEGIFRPGFAYSKAEVLLMDLRQRGEFTQDLFAPSQPARSDALMEVMDRVNRRWGHDCLRSAAMPATPDWGMKRAFLSPRFLSDWNELWTVHCR